MQMAGLAGEIGYLVAVPAVVFGLGGAYLDSRFGTKPAFILTGLFLALCLSSFAVYRVVKRILSAQS